MLIATIHHIAQAEADVPAHVWCMAAINISLDHMWMFPTSFISSAMHEAVRTSTYLIMCGCSSSSPTTDSVIRAPINN